MALINLNSIIRAPSSGWRKMCFNRKTLQTLMLQRSIAAPWAWVSERQGSFRQRCFSGGSAEGAPVPGLLSATALGPGGAPGDESMQYEVHISLRQVSFKYILVQTCSDSWTCSWRFLVTTSSVVLWPSAPDTWGGVWSCFSTDSLSSSCNLAKVVGVKWFFYRLNI